MGENKEIIKEAVSQTEGVLTEVYKDTLQPTLKPIGQIISYPTRLLRLAFSPLEKWMVGAEASIRIAAENVEKKVAQIPEEKIVPLEANIAVPAIMQLSYCENSVELRNLYANLLATSMNVDKKWEVHPAYVDIIKQLTPDEAKFLSALHPMSIISYPLIDVRLKNKNGYNTIFSNFTDVNQTVLEHPTMIANYIYNLSRLGLIIVPDGVHLIDESIYNRVEQNPMLLDMISQSNLQGFSGLSYGKKLFHLTDFGVSFVNVCCIG